ncbi:MAG: substrate-binding domain-containing protein [Beijerinckiaceae bacterium]
MKRIAIAAVLLTAVSVPALARDRIQITGSSTVFPFTTAVAERFGQKTGKTPIVESTGTGGGMKLFCSGVGVQTPDVTNASRRMTKTEFDECSKNGVQAIEIKMGFDGIVLANSKAAPAMALSLEQLYLAMAAEVPNAQGQLVPNPNKNWSDIAPNLPNKKIEVLGPPPTSGTRDSFNELGLLEGCKVAQKRTNAKIDNRKCMQVRADGAFIEAGENDNIIVQKLVANPMSYGVFGYSFLEENQDKIHGAKINDLEPSTEAIQNGKYSMARSMFVYVKKNHIGVVPGIAEFVAEYVSEGSFGDDGYLEKKGLVPLPKAERETIRKSATGGTVLTGF